MKDNHLDGQASSGKVMIRNDAPEEFYCFRCRTNKKAKLRAEWETTEGVKVICNGCYGELIAITRLELR